MKKFVLMLSLAVLMAACSTLSIISNETEKITYRPPLGRDGYGPVGLTMNVPTGYEIIVEKAEEGYGAAYLFFYSKKNINMTDILRKR